jgi:lysophospholipase L1-like esterase
MAFGDSMTAGEVLNATRVKVVNAALSYPTQLRSLLLARYVSQSVVVTNEGVPGEGLLDAYGARNDATRLRYGAAVSADLPDAVLLLEGVNDLGGGQEPQIEQQIASVLGAMVDEAYAAGVKTVFLATEPPMIPGLLRSQNAARVPVLNALIRTTATQHRAVLVDLYAAMIGNVNALINSDDGLHPYPAGYLVMAQTFFTAIQSNFELSAAPATFLR